MSNADSSRKALGRGLSALLPSTRPLAPHLPSYSLRRPQALRIPIDEIDQTRSNLAAVSRQTAWLNSLNPFASTASSNP